MKPRAEFCLRKQAGLSLIELMVAITISMIILAALTGVMVNTKRSNTEQNAFGRLQENGRIATQIMSRELRQAGYFGCGGQQSASLSVHLNPNATYSNIYNVSVPLEGAETGGTMFPGAGTAPAGATSDVVAVRYLDGTNAITIDTPYMNQKSSALHVSTGNGLQPNEIVMVSDCNGGDVFQITSANPNTSGTITHNTGSGVPGNATNELSRIYEGDARILKFISSYYYIKPNASGQPSLYRLNNGNEEELVEGIEDLQVAYGVDLDNDGNPDRYLKPGATGLTTTNDWRQVRTVRFGMLARSLANNTTTGNKTTGPVSTAELDSNTYDIDGDGTDDLDASTLSDEERRYIRKVFRTTIYLRNRLL